VESKRCAGVKGLNDSTPSFSLTVVDLTKVEHPPLYDLAEGSQRAQQLVLFSADRAVPEHAKHHAVQVRLDAMQLHRPGQWGACWLACNLYGQLAARRA